MAAKFKFTPQQRAAIAKELGTEVGVAALEGAVEDFRIECANQMTRAEIAEHLRIIKRSCREMRRSIKALSKGNRFSADWILDPVTECERCASGMYKYKFAGPLKRGRMHNTAKTHLVHVAAMYWEQIVGKKPGLGRGPFSRLIGKLLQFSAVNGASMKYPDELVRESLPPEISVEICRQDYPFASIRDQHLLPPLALSAERFFGHVMWVSNGSPTAFATVSTPAGKNGPEI